MTDALKQSIISAAVKRGILENGNPSDAELIAAIDVMGMGPKMTGKSKEMGEALEKLIGALDKYSYLNDYGGIEISKHDASEVRDVIEAGRVALLPSNEGAEPVAGWISVKDRLPEDDCHALVADWFRMDGTQHLSIASFRHGTGEFSGYSPSVVTHWMPLPAAPGAQTTEGAE